MRQPANLTRAARPKKRLMIVRQLPFLLLLLWPILAGAAETPEAPADHIYDPDFLITRQASFQMSQSFAELGTKGNMTVYLAAFTSPPKLIDETSDDLNQAWNQSGYGVTITFVPRDGEARVLPSPQLSLVEGPAHLTEIFKRAARAGLDRGDYSAAAQAGAQAVVQRLTEVREEMAAPAKSRWHLSRRWILGILAVFALAGAIFLWNASRVWRAANLWDRRYRLPAPVGPPALRLGGTRSGGQMATIDFRRPLKAEDV